MKKFLLLLTVYISAQITGCGFENASDPYTQLPDTTGTIRVNLLDLVNAKLHLPDIDMNIVMYDVIGTGPGNNGFEVYDIRENTYINDSVPLGKWNIQVFGKNSEATVIGSGQTDVVVSANKVSKVDITVVPLDGTGTLNLTINWKAGDLLLPSIYATLISSSGEMRTLDFTITGGNCGTCSLSGINSGYYILTTKLLENGIVTMGAVEMVRIVSEQTTKGTYDFVLLNKPGGTIEVNIEQEMADPIDVLISGQKESITTSEEMTVTASVAPEDGPVVYVWYINGDTVETGGTCTVYGFDEGFYRLDVTVFSVDGTKGGSETYLFEIKDDK
jgi:hypothetical protein